MQFGEKKNEGETNFAIMWNENRVYFTCMSFELISSKNSVNFAFHKLALPAGRKKRSQLTPTNFFCKWNSATMPVVFIEAKSPTLKHKSESSSINSMV